MSSRRSRNISPWCPMLKHGIHHRQQFSHTGRQCDLGRFAGLAQSWVEGFQDTIMTSCYPRAPREGSPYGSAATPDRPFSTEGAAVSIQWGDADQGRDLLVRQGPQLRQFCQQRPSDDGANARGRSATARPVPARSGWPGPRWSAPDRAAPRAVGVTRCAVESGFASPAGRGLDDCSQP